MTTKTAPFLLEKSPGRPWPAGRGRVSTPFIDKGIQHIAKVIRTAYAQWETASQQGFLQGLDARVKVLVTLFFIVIVSLKKDVTSELYLAAFVLALAAASRLDLVSLYRRVVFFGFFFGFLVALPSSLNLIRPGQVVLPLMSLAKPYNLWIYHLPRDIGMTREGLRGVALLTARVANSVSISLLLLYTTPFTEIIRALKVLRVPDTFLIVVTLTYKYIFIFAQTVEDMHLAKKSRMVGGAGADEARQWVVGRIGLIFTRTQRKCEELHKAMISRGFSGEVRLRGFRAATGRDYVAGLALGAAGVFFLWL